MKFIYNLKAKFKKMTISKIDPNFILLLLVIVFFVLLFAAENVVKLTLLPN